MILLILFFFNNYILYDCVFKSPRHIFFTIISHKNQNFKRTGVYAHQNIYIIINIYKH